MFGGNGDIQNVAQDIEALRDRMDVQEVAVRTLEVASYNSSDEEDDLILAKNQNRPARRGGGRLKGLLHRRQREGKQPVRTWFRMKQLLKSEFLPPDYEQILFQQYQRCQQNQRSVQEYTIDFMRLAERNDLRESEVHQVSRYLDGLKPHIRDRIGVQVVKSVTEAKNLAIKAKLMIRYRGGSRIECNRRTYGNDNFQRSNSGEDTSRSFADRSKIAQGWNQGTKRKEYKGLRKKVAESKERQKAATNPYAKPILGKYFRCGQPGHRSKVVRKNLLLGRRLPNQRKDKCPARKPERSFLTITQSGREMEKAVKE
ncbi:hypothetical protein M9H77_32294 [Catharanthus roseus]|uniref:Uncharacterized protein n=1 Tax=Catharanthus roseus TaxID=4058 RepID=A0ACC0A2J2_CATRO|nr:hypothetical protein M9H77_32294 [Catharanthus roseus]